MSTQNQQVHHDIATLTFPVQGEQRSYGGATGGTCKRAIDVLISAAALIFLIPIFLLVAAVIKLSDGGPVFYVHPRVGHRGRMFGCLKFRTMCIDSDMRLRDHLARCPKAAAEWRATQKLRSDPRLTAIGPALRRSSLDELPQLINVLRGDMSLVGPRPVVVEEIGKYGEFATDYFSARPGLTGRWQISGRNDLPYAERVRLDVSYCREWSLQLDILILLRTVPVLFTHRGSY